MTSRKNYSPKPLFLERMKEIMGEDFDSYLNFMGEEPLNSIRCNTIKISPKELKKRLSEKGWKIKQPFKKHEEIMIIENKLLPGELGRSIEHLLGYYYVQEISSMLSILALNPQPGETLLDLCASPGSKTTQAAAAMNNQGMIIANDSKMGRIAILAANLQRCGCTNAIITKKDGIALCKRFEKQGFQFDKILLDAPCSGEGTIRSSPATLQMWNPQTITNLSRLQKALLASAINILKPGGKVVYSTCTHAPEENEEVVDFAINNFKNIKIEETKLPVKYRKGITNWRNKEYSKEVIKSCRIYPQDNDTEGFFLVKIKKLK